MEINKKTTWILVGIIALIIIGMLVQKNYPLFAIGDTIIFRTTYLNADVRNEIAYTETCGNVLSVYGVNYNQPAGAPGYGCNNLPSFGNYGTLIYVMDVPGSFEGYSPIKLYKHISGGYDNDYYLCADKGADGFYMLGYKSITSFSIPTSPAPVSGYEGKEVLCGGVISVPEAQISQIDFTSSARAGESVRLFIYLKNIGQGTGDLSSKIYDNDDNSLIASGGVTLNPGSSGWANTITTSMPDKAWRLRIEAGHYESSTLIIDEIQNQTIRNPDYCTLNADVNCDNKVDRNELGIFITKWINNQATRTELGQAIMAWVNG